MRRQDAGLYLSHRVDQRAAEGVESRRDELRARLRRVIEFSSLDEGLSPVGESLISRYALTHRQREAALLEACPSVQLRRLFRFLVHSRSDGRELVVSGLLFFKIVLQQRCDIRQTQQFGEIARRTIARHFIVLNTLRGGDECGITNDPPFPCPSGPQSLLHARPACELVLPVDCLPTIFAIRTKRSTCPSSLRGGKERLVQFWGGGATLLRELRKRARLTSPSAPGVLGIDEWV